MNKNLRINPLRIIALVLGVVLAFCGCCATESGSEVSSAPIVSGSGNLPQGSITLAYTANDSLDPYTAMTKTNQELCGLLFDGLVVLDDSFTPHYRLAGDIQNDGTVVTVTLANALFSDGSKVTAADVVASLEAARAAEHLSYAADFENVKEVAVTENGLVQLTLHHQDPYFVNFLDFPIFKEGSREVENNDNKPLPPIGSGRFVYHEEGDRYWLTANPKWIGGRVAIPHAELTNMPDQEAISHAASVGRVDWCYADLSNNQFPNMNGVSRTVNLPNLVYLGANMRSGVMSIQEVRLGVSTALDRQNIAQTAYFDMATPAKGPLPDGVEAASGLQSLSPLADTAAATEWFGKAGFATRTPDGFCSNGELTLSVQVIYNSDNTARQSIANLLQTSLQNAGCRVELKGLSFEDYCNAIKWGNYDIYIGEMAIPDNFDLYRLLTAGGLIPLYGQEAEEEEDEEEEEEQNEDSDPSQDVPSGQDPSAEPEVLSAATAVSRYHNGKGSLTEVLSQVGEQLPIIPLCFRRGMLVYTAKLKGDPAPLWGDPFYGIEHCTVQ